MLLKHLPAKDLGEQVSWVGVARDVTQIDAASTTQLTHLEQFAIDVTRVLRGSKAVAQVMRTFVICETLDGSIDREANELNQVGDVSPCGLRR